MTAKKTPSKPENPEIISEDRRSFITAAGATAAGAVAIAASGQAASAQEAAAKPQIPADQPTTLPPNRTFLGAPGLSDINELDAEIAFLGIPNDQGTNTPSEITGQSQAPDTIRNFSPTVFLNIGSVGLYDVDDDVEHVKGVTLADCGNVITVGNDVENNYARVEESVRRILRKGAIPFCVGGDHSNMIPIMRGFEEYGKPFDVIQFDAHLDFGKDFLGAPYSNNSNMYVTRQLPYVNDIYALGIRHCTKQQFQEVKDAGTTIITARQMVDAGNAQDRIINSIIPEGRDVYITFDIDALDGAVAPGTTIPVPGGINYYQALDALKAIAKRANVIGFDMMEVHPTNDPHNITSRLAGWIMSRTIGYIKE
jgi:agmatinase